MIKYKSENRVFYFSHEHSPNAKHTLKEVLQRLILQNAKRELTQDTPLAMCENQSEHETTS